MFTSHVACLKSALSCHKKWHQKNLRLNCFIFDVHGLYTTLFVPYMKYNAASLHCTHTQWLFCVLGHQKWGQYQYNKGLAVGFVCSSIECLKWTKIVQTKISQKLMDLLSINKELYMARYTNVLFLKLMQRLGKACTQSKRY